MSKSETKGLIDRLRKANTRAAYNLNLPNTRIQPKGWMPYRKGVMSTGDAKSFG